MKIKVLILLTTILSLFGCKKRQDTVFKGDPNGITEPEYTFECKDLGWGPATDWQYTNLYSDSSITAFLYNPQNPQEIVYMLTGSGAKYRPIYCYNTSTQQKTFLDAGIMYLPQINKKGWVVYGKMDFNIYKVKTNGDSLTQLTFNGGEDPHWDYTGNNIYYYKQPVGGKPPIFIKMSKDGLALDTVEEGQYFAAFGKTEDKIAYVKLVNGKQGVYLKYPGKNFETRLFQAETTNPAHSGFAHMVFDNTDRALYWYNQTGIYKYNLSLHRTETIVKSCTGITPSYTFIYPCLAPGIDKLTIAYRGQRAISSSYIQCQFRTFDVDLQTKKLKELNLY